MKPTDDRQLIPKCFTVNEKLSSEKKVTQKNVHNQTKPVRRELLHVRKLS